MPHRIERHFAQERAVPPTFPRAPARQLADTGQGLEAEALAGVGRALTDTGEILAKWYEREGNSEYDASRGGYQSLLGEFERTTYKDSTALDAGAKKLETDIAKIPAGSGLKNKVGLRKYKAFTDLNKAGREKLIAEKKIRMIARNNQVSLFNNLLNVAKQPDQVKAMAEIELLIRGGLDDGSIKTAAQATNLREKTRENWLRADVWRRSTSIVRPDGEVDYQAAADWFNIKENVEGLPEDIIEDFGGTARSLASAQNAGDKVVLENQRKTDRQNILDKMLKDEFTDMESFVNATTLSPEEKLSWIDRADKRANAIINNKKIVTDERVRGELEEMANDIAIGSLTKEQVTEEANQARYTDETIDDAAYSQIRTLIDREHKSYQSTAIKEGVSFGAGQLISITQSVLDTLLAADVTVDLTVATKRRELELWNHGQYRKAINDWLTVNPEADADEIYIQSRKLVTQYRRPIEDIEKARADFEQRLQAGEPLPPAKVRGRFANPVKVESPLGGQGWSSEEHFKQTLEPLGFKKIEGKNADDSKTR